jgi:transcription initiation factor TFIID subunit TAF12
MNGINRVITHRTMNTKERIAYLDGAIDKLQSEMAEDYEVFEARQKNRKALLKQWREEQIKLCREGIAAIDKGQA